jgi:hypothetical protein
VEDEHTVADTLADEAARGPRMVDPLEALVTPRQPPEEQSGATARDVLAVYAARAGNWLREARWRWRSRRQVVYSTLLVLGGLGLACTGGWLIGMWCLGLVLLVIAGGMVFAGLSRDDGAGDRPARGARTVGQALADARLSQEAQERRETEAASL